MEGGRGGSREEGGGRGGEGSGKDRKREKRRENREHKALVQGADRDHNHMPS